MSEAQPFHVESDGTLVHVRMGEHVGVACASALHEALMAVLTRRADSRFDWSATHHADACALQLCTSFAQSARARGAQVEHTGIGDELRSFLAISGFDSALGVNAAVGVA